MEEWQELMNTKIVKLCGSNALINASIGLYTRGELSYEQSLEVAVIALEEQHGILQRKLIECRAETASGRQSAARG